jgi:hypothetical protein
VARQIAGENSLAAGACIRIVDLEDLIENGALTAGKIGTGTQTPLPVTLAYLYP